MLTRIACLLQETNKKLAAIESLLQRLPEIEAAVSILMQEEYNQGRLAGKSASDLWEIIPPDQR